MIGGVEVEHAFVEGPARGRVERGAGTATVVEGDDELRVEAARADPRRAPCVRQAGVAQARHRRDGRGDLAREPEPARRAPAGAVLRVRPAPRRRSRGLRAAQRGRLRDRGRGTRTRASRRPRSSFRRTCTRATSATEVPGMPTCAFDRGSVVAVSLDTETGRDRYFAAREAELRELVDPETGLVSERFAKHVDCPSCGSSAHSELFVKGGYPIVRCDECSLVFSNPQVDESVVLEEYREGGSNDLWVDVLTSPRQLELDRAKFDEILDELEPHRGGRSPARRGHLDRPLPPARTRSRLDRPRHGVRASRARVRARRAERARRRLADRRARRGVRRRDRPLGARAREPSARVPPARLDACSHPAARRT